MRLSFYHSLIVFLLLFSGLPCITRAQVQFWNLADLEDEQVLPARKDQKIKLVKLYRVDERGRQIDTTGPDELRSHDMNGQLTARQVYKYNWNKRKRELLRADSFFYNTKGQLVTYRAYEGDNYRCTYETLVKYNNKNLPVQQDHYNFYNYERKLEQSDLFVYDAKNLPKKITTVNKMDKASNSSRLFFFNAKGKLIKTQFITPGGTITTVIGRDAGGKLTSYQELYGKDIQKTILYTYDASGRLSRKETKGSSGYYDFTTYTYDGNNPLVATTYLQYPGYGGNSDRRHEYTAWVYEAW